MTEPVYSYVKGQGWQPNVPEVDSYRFPDNRGKWWTVYARAPNIGERWDASTTGYKTAEDFG